MPDVLSRLPARRTYEYYRDEDVLDDLVITFILDTVAESYIVSTTLDISANFKKAL